MPVFAETLLSPLPVVVGWQVVHANPTISGFSYQVLIMPQPPHVDICSLHPYILSHFVPLTLSLIFFTFYIDPRVLRHRKKRPGVDFFAKANSAGLTNLPNQERFYI